MWQSHTKVDLIIEVWEKLDCESVGQAEIESIEEAVRARFGTSAVDSPMRIARLLADEGADLRHSEIMDLWVERRRDTPYNAEFLNLVKLTNFADALRSIRNLENLRKKLTADGDKQGLRFVRDEVLSAKRETLENAKNRKLDAQKRAEQKEISEWITIWLQSPEVFENWINLRQNSIDFQKKFGDIRS